MSDSSEVSFHMILIIPCHSEIFLCSHFASERLLYPNHSTSSITILLCSSGSSPVHYCPPIMWDFPLHQKAIGLELVLFVMHFSSIFNVSISLARTMYYKRVLYCYWQWHFLALGTGSICKFLPACSEILLFGNWPVQAGKLVSKYLTLQI